MEYSQTDNEKILKKISQLNKEISELKEENKILKEKIQNENNFYKDLSEKKNEESKEKLKTIQNLENKIFEFSGK